jgi:hypothetical protein
VREVNEQARKSGLPVVEGEVLWEGPDGLLYHYYPTLEQVRAWVGDAGFAIEEEAEEPWHEEHTYQHMLARLAAPLG